MKKILETDRLILQEFNVKDANFIIDLMNSEGWIKYIGDRNIKTEAQAIHYISTGPMKSYDVNGFGLLMVLLKENNQPIGMCGLLKRDTLENIDLGFAFLPSYTGSGFALEAAAATLKYGFEKLKQEHIVAITLSDNTRSIKLLQKLGFTYEAPYQSQDDTLMLFGVSKNN
jgi:RimJ/RimL family protein N-acetyltransferase